LMYVHSAFYGLELLEAQVIQHDARSLIVRIVPAPGFTEADTETIRRRFRDRVGGMQVRIKKVTMIERGPSGKFRAVIGLPDSEGSRGNGHTDHNNDLQSAAD